LREQKTVVIYDYEEGCEISALARALSDDPLLQGSRFRVVVSRSEAPGAAEDLPGQGFEVIEAPDGAGPAERKNLGLERSRGDAILLSAWAELVDPQWLQEMLEELEPFGGEGVAGCKLVDERDRIINAGYHMLQPEFEPLSIGGFKRDINQYYYSREVEGVDSGCMYISGSALESAGRFDEELGAGYDNTDFCLKARQAGLPVICVGSTRVVMRRRPEALQRVRGRVADEKYRSLYRERWSDYYRSRYETAVMWHSWINAPSGYAVSSQYLVLAMEQLGVDVRYGYVYGVEEPPNDDERIMEVRRKPKDLDITQVVYGQGDVFFKNSGRYRVGYSMLEVTGIPPDWVEQANSLDEIWVPSHFNLDTFAGSGVTRPIKVMPLGVDINYFHPFISSKKQHGRFVFLSVFEWGERKAPEVLLQAYNQEFSGTDDVLLVLKVNNNDPAVNIERQIEAMRLRPDRAPVLVVLNQKVPSYQMGSLYCSSDCFVLPTRGEGWGMPTLEAMACGLPVISTDWSAQTEFFGGDVGYPVEVKRLIPAVAKCPYYEGFEWADPDVEHLAQLMRYVYENPEEARAKGLRASISAREKWSWLDSARRIKERIMEISP
jgi:glycosyltransferase involved in cell wall biosynthesis